MSDTCETIDSGSYYDGLHYDQDTGFLYMADPEGTVERVDQNGDGHMIIYDASSLPSTPREIKTSDGQVFLRKQQHLVNY